MTFLQIVFICASLLFAGIAINLKIRNKIKIATCIIIVAGSLFVLVSSFNISFLNSFSAKLGISRGAELIVYCSIIFLGLMFFHLMSRSQKNQFDLSRLVSQMAINEAWNEKKEEIKSWHNKGDLDEIVVHMRVYNEAQTLKKCVEEVMEYGFRKFIFVNDGSRDNSLEILRDLEKEHPECLIVICSHEINRGGGAANKTGFGFIQQHGDSLGVKEILTFDPDGQMDIEDFRRLDQKISENCSLDSSLRSEGQSVGQAVDIYVGSRFVKGGSSENMPMMRRIILIISRIVTQVLYGTKVSDPHIGFRLYSLEAMKKIRLTADGMHYANEINEQIKQLGLRFKEFPVHIRYTEYSLGKGQKNANSIKLGIEMLYNKFF